MMEFSERREEAVDHVQAQLREPLTPDAVLVHAWRCVEDRPKALERWLFSIRPDLHPEKAREAVVKDGRDVWDPMGRGADMDDLGWDALIAICKGEAPDLDKLAEHTGRNLHVLLGASSMAEMLAAAGGLLSLARITQRDCMRLGNESGTFGGPDSSSILERHELTTNDRALRVLASRVVLAARLDAYKGQFKGESLRQEVLYAQ